MNTVLYFVLFWIAFALCLHVVIWITFGVLFMLFGDRFLVALSDRKSNKN